MLILIVASACLAGAALVMTRVATQPERTASALVRSAARYGAVRIAAARENRLSLRERVLLPVTGRLAGLDAPRSTARESLAQVQQRLLAAGMSTVSPSGYLARGASSPRSAPCVGDHRLGLGRRSHGLRVRRWLRPRGGYIASGLHRRRTCAEARERGPGGSAGRARPSRRQRRSRHGLRRRDLAS